jgi:hypothetical protein
VPWCDDCAKFWNPATMLADGSCPSCGRKLAAPVAAVAAGAGEGGDRLTADTIDVKALAGDDAKVPWHFKLLVAALCIYLGWRLVQLVVWAVT